MSDKSKNVLNIQGDQNTLANVHVGDNFGPPQRRITEAQARAFRVAADDGQGHAMTTRCNDNSAEAIRFERGLLAMIGGTPGWRATSQGQLFNTLPHVSTGLVLEVSRTEPLNPAAERLSLGLDAAGIPHRIHRGQWREDQDIARLVIGASS
jgi:hypothetical protein